MVFDFCEVLNRFLLCKINKICSRHKRLCIFVPMKYIQHYHTPQGFDDLVMSSDGQSLTGLWFEGSRDEDKHLLDSVSSPESTQPAIFSDVCRWLDIYFSGRQPDFIPAFRMEGLTPFRKLVSELMCEIPFGQTVTYGGMAKRIEEMRQGLSLQQSKMSAQAVGGAVGWNPICIIVPCHRVVGANGNLTGYGGGMHNKIALLKHEGLDLSQLFLR